MTEAQGRVGNDFLIYVQTDTDDTDPANPVPVFTEVGGQRGLETETTREMIDLSHKGSDHSQSGYGRQNTTASMEGIQMEGDTGYDALEDAINNKTLIMAEIRDNGQPYREAEVLISNLSKSYADNDAVTASFEMQLNQPWQIPAA